MRSPGFVYVLLNQSLPGCVKIGKTTRDSTARAAELSSATGVPTPFLVAYEAHFQDCDQAESYVHALLAEAGARLAKNREFFTVSAPEAINIVMRAHRELGGGTAGSAPATDVDWRQLSTEEAIEKLDAEILGVQRLPYEDALREALVYLHGEGDTLQDNDRAIERFKRAAMLGSHIAYSYLAGLHPGQQGIEWLKRGAEKGAMECWLTLGLAFSGETMESIDFPDIPTNDNEALKCFCRYFEGVDPKIADSMGDSLYQLMRRCLALINRRPSALNHDLRQRAVEVMERFATRFRASLSEISDEEDRRAKLRALDDLVTATP